MNMKKKRTPAVILAALMLMTLAAGPAMAENQQGAQPQENGAFGQVTQIDGSTITIALASMGGPGGQAAQGNPPSDNGGQAPQGNPPSDNSGQAPQGNPPSDNGGQGRGFGGSLTLTGETLTFIVSDATQITLRGNRDAQDTLGSISDIQVGSVVTVFLDGDAATSIAVRQTPEMSNAGEAPAGN